MRVVLDSNVLVYAFSRKSPLNFIFEGLIRGDYTLCVTTDILDEYAEIIERKKGAEFSTEAIEFILGLPNILKIEKFFFWQLLTDDPDDNKFVDCAIAANAHVLVTHDKHFNVLKEVDFPEVRVVDADTFREMLSERT
jgi:putative PIN family toxin of toxin-antitoxin system